MATGILIKDMDLDSFYFSVESDHCEDAHEGDGPFGFITTLRVYECPTIEALCAARVRFEQEFRQDGGPSGLIPRTVTLAYVDQVATSLGLRRINRKEDSHV